MTDKRVLLGKEMARPILDGRVYRLRRVIKPQPSDEWEPSHSCEIHRMENGQPVEPRTKRDILGWGWSDRDGLEGHVSWIRPGDVLCLCFYPDITAKVVVADVRPERLQDISDADARREGPEPGSPGIERAVERMRFAQQHRGRPDLVNDLGFAARCRYALWWDRRHHHSTKRKWAANPWVWVIEFELMEESK